MNMTSSPPPAVPADRQPAPRPPRNRKTALVAAIALVAVLAAVGLAWTFGRGEKSPDTPPPAAGEGETPTAGGLAARDLDGDGIVYQDGMHPWIVEDAPGRCPICGMELQPVPVSGAPAGTVEIDPVTLQNIGVRTATVERRAIERTLRATGTFAPVDAARQAVSLKIGGWVEKLYVATEGQQVRRGQPLLALYSPDLVATQQEYLLALRNRELLGGGPDASRVVEAARTRLRLYDISDAQVEKLATTGEVQRTLTLYAPASGTVVGKNVVEGQQVGAGATLMEIVNLSTLWLQVDVPEADLGWIEKGTAAEVTLTSQPGEPITGHVEYVYDLLDAATRTGTARIAVANRGGRIKPGMFATATLYGAATASGPVVPAEAVVRTGREAAVILALGGGRFRPQPVVLGAEGGGFVQILEGLEGGESVVTSAQFLLDSEARLSSSVAAMTGAGAAQTPGGDEMPAADHSQMHH